MPKFNKKRLLLFLVFSALIFVNFSYAHDASLAYTYIYINENEISINVTVPNDNFNRIFQSQNISGEYKSNASDYVKSGIRLSNDNEACSSILSKISDINGGSSTRYSVLFDCREPLIMLNFSYNLF